MMRDCLRRHGVFPAPAGMNRDQAIVGNDDDRVPRASGDEPNCSTPAFAFTACSPRQRG